MGCGVSTGTHAVSGSGAQNGGTRPAEEVREITVWLARYPRKLEEGEGKLRCEREGLGETEGIRIWEGTKGRASRGQLGRSIFAYLHTSPAFHFSFPPLSDDC